jgi:acyl carrier protein
MVGLEESGIIIPMEAAWDVQTVGDAYRVYKESASAGT